MSVNLLQAQAAVRMLKNLVASGRKPQYLLDEALERLRQAHNAPSPELPTVATLQNAPTQLPKSEIEKVQADLSAEADVLYREQAEISMQIIETDPAIPCPELTAAAIEKRKAIERIWTKKKHIERNGLVDDQEDEPDERSAADIQEISMITVEMKKLSEKRSKLGKKLNNLGASEKMRVKWQTELAKAEAEYNELKNKRDLL